MKMKFLLALATLVAAESLNSSIPSNALKIDIPAGFIGGRFKVVSLDGSSACINISQSPCARTITMHLPEVRTSPERARFPRRDDIPTYGEGEPQVCAVPGMSFAAMPASTTSVLPAYTACLPIPLISEEDLSSVDSSLPAAMPATTSEPQARVVPGMSFAAMPAFRTSELPACTVLDIPTSEEDEPQAYTGCIPLISEDDLTFEAPSLPAAMPAFRTSEPQVCAVPSLPAAMPATTSEPQARVVSDARFTPRIPYKERLPVCTPAVREFLRNEILTQFSSLEESDIQIIIDIYAKSDMDAIELDTRVCKLRRAFRNMDSRALSNICDLYVQADLLGPAEDATPCIPEVKLDLCEDATSCIPE